MKQLFTTLLFFVYTHVTMAQINAGLIEKFYFNNGTSQSDVSTTYLDTFPVLAPILTSDRFGNNNKAYEFKYDMFKYVSQQGGSYESNKVNLDDLSALSISVWIKPILLDGHRCILGRWNNNPAQEQFLLEFRDGVLLMACRGGSSHGVYDTTAYKVRKWYHIVFIYEKQNNRQRLYVNGTKKYDQTFTKAYTNTSQPAPLVIGAKQINNHKGDFFEGIIDDIAFYDRALTDAEVSCLYNEPNPTTPLGNPVTVTVSASASEVCSGNPVTISATATGPVTSYQWNWNVFSSDTGGTVIPQSTTTYGVIVRDSTSCRSAASSVTVTVHPLPQPTITQNGNVLSTQTFNSYQWQWNGNNINGATNQNFTATQNGSYTVQVTDANGCSNTSGAVNVTGVGVSEVADFRSVIYPNPVTNVLNIESDEDMQNIQITDVTGRVIFTQTNLATRNAQLATDFLAEATYFIHIKTATGKMAVKSFVKQ